MRTHHHPVTDLLARVAFVVGVAAAPVAHARTFDVPCDVAALDDAVEAAGFNDQEDVLWLAPSCAYPLPGILIAYPDAGFPITIQGRGATISGQHQRTALLVNAGATVYLEGVTVTAGRAGPTASGDGGAIYDAGTLTLTRSTVSDSEAARGGGIYVGEGASLTLVESTVSGNTSGTRAGGIWNDNGRLTLISSTVSGNRAVGSQSLGGGIYNHTHGSGRAIATLTNSTFSGNASRFGGGVYNDNGTLVVSHCTFSDNTMLDGGNGGAVYHQNYTGLGSFKLGNSILANSIAEVGVGYDCVRDPFLPDRPVIASGVNLIEDASCVVAGAWNGDPKLGALTGAPAYHPLLPGSPMIDFADDARCPGFDQRNAPRPRDGNGNGSVACDVGAYEAP